jgi:hypothetical protein
VKSEKQIWVIPYIYKQRVLPMNPAKSLPTWCLRHLVLMMALCAFINGCGNGDSGPVLRTEFWVSPQGDDGAAGTADAPFASLERARDAIRALPALQRSGYLVVTLKGGTYRLKRPLVLDWRDSGLPGRPVVYRAAAGARPVIVGSMPVQGWSQNPGQAACTASVSPVNSRQLYVNGSRAMRARTSDYPASFRPGFFYLDGVAHPDGIQFLVSDLNPQAWRDPYYWGNIPDIEAVLVTQWKMMSVPLASVIPYPDYTPYPQFLPYVPLPGFPPLPVPSQTGLIQMQTEGWNNANLFLSSETNQPGIWGFWQVTRFENSLAFLDQPGEWYLDRSGASGTLYYIPRTGENMATAQVELPFLNSLVEGQGTLEQPLANIRFEGLTFSYATWMDPSMPQGYVSDQSGFHLRGTEHKPNIIGHDPDLVRTPGAVSFRYARNITFEGNTFSHLGAVGLDLGTGSQGNRVVNNLFIDISSAAIQLGGVSKDDHHPSYAGQVTQNNVISNNFIQNAGQEFVDAAGIFVGFTRQTLVSNNTIIGVPWSGIAFGWGWGLLDPGMFPGVPGAIRGQWGTYTTPTPNSKNRILNNLVEDFLQVTWDGGAIYTTGFQGTSMRDALLIQGNVARGKRASGGGNVFYTDGGSRYIVLKNNVSYDNPTGVTYFGPDAQETDQLKYPPYSGLNNIPYGFDFGGCRTYGDIVFEENYVQNLWYFDIVCPYTENGVYYPTNLSFINNFKIQGAQDVPESILNAAGVQNFPQGLLDAKRVQLSP